jgi:predicted permease
MRRRLCHLLVRLLPADLRAAHEREIRGDIDRRCRDGRGWSTLADLAATIVRGRGAHRASLLSPPVTTSTGATMMQAVLQDLRFAFRMFARQPGFTLAAILTLGLGIGSATAVISLADATLLRPLAAREPDRLAEMPWSMSYPDMREMQKRADAFEGVFAYSGLGGVSFARQGATQRVPATLVTGNYFEVLGVTPAAGRLLNASDELPGSMPPVVISDRLWHRAFGASPAVIGEAMTVNGRPVTVVGVAPAEFRGLSLSSVADLWMPAAFAPDLATGFVGRPAALEAGMNWLRVVGRMRPGLDLEEASARVEAFYTELHPPSPGDDREKIVLERVASTVVGRGARRATLEQFILLLFAVAAVLLLLGCANVANLLLARAAARRQEVGIRVALGAGRTRLMMQLLVESALLGTAGAGAGLAIASGGLQMLGQYQLPGALPIEDLGLRINGTVFGTALVLASIAVLIFGLVPAWLTSRRDINAVLRDSGRTSTRAPLSRTLVVLQVALSVALIGGGLLFARGLQRGLAFDLGYEPSGVVMMTADPSLERLSLPLTNAYLAGTLERLRANGSIASAGVSMMRPMRGSMSMSFAPAGYVPPTPNDTHVAVNIVSDGWFEALGLELIRGRTFEERDRTSPQPVIVVSESMARKYWPGQDPVGLRVKVDEDDTELTEVIGIVGDARYGSVDAQPEPYLYLPMFSTRGAAFRGESHFFARYRGSQSAALAALRQSLQAENARVPIYGGMTLEDHVGTVLMPQRLGLVLMMAFAAAALVLASAGVYAIAASAVAARRREIGIRMALGAGRGRVLRQIIREGSAPVLIGAAAGIGIQMWAATLAESFVFGLDARAPLQLAAAAAVVIAAALVALSLPARRAASIEPTIALRE